MESIVWDGNGLERGYNRKVKNDKVILSIGMLTYNQAKYVRQTLDGIVMQKVDFRYEVIVGDDCSTDGTQDILREYAERYPGIFKLVLREKNIGVTRNNFDLKHRACGKYFACLEGDDYWTDENKLQIQVDFLESHQEYIACVHKCLFVDENSNPKENTPINGWYCNKEVFSLKEFERGELPGQTATLMYRNIFLDKTKDFSIMYKASDKIGDKTAILLLLSYGNIYNMDRVMSCYRYVIQAGESNVSSDYIGKNNRDELVKYLITLEEYARKELHIPLDMSYKKKNVFVAAVTVWLKNPIPENAAVMNKIIALSGNPFAYRLLKYKTIVLKRFGWKLLRKDIRIKI